MIERLVLAREHGQRAVVAHRTNRLFGRRRHRRHQKLQIFLGVPKRLLQIEQRLRRPEISRCGRHIGRRSIGSGTRCLATIQISAGVANALELDPDLLDPLAIGFAGRELIFQLFVINNAALLEVDQKHLAGLQTPFVHDTTLGHGQNPSLGGHDHQSVVGDAIARGSQAVAVERRTDLATIGKGKRSWTIPRLHHRRMELVERTPAGVHQGVIFPGFRDHHHDGMRDRITRHHQQLEAIIKRGCIALAGIHNRIELAQIVAKNGRLHGALARPQPVVIALDRVDLTVVSDQSIRVSKRPFGERVGRKALMHEGKRRDNAGVSKIDVIATDLIAEQQAFVNDSTSAHRRHKVLATMGEIECLNRVARHLSDHVQLALERIGDHHIGTTPDEDLPDHGLCGAHGRRHRHRVIHGHIAPAEQDLTGRPNRPLEFLFTGEPRRIFFGQKHHANAVVTRWRQRDALRR